MKRCPIALALCIVVVGCDRARLGGNPLSPTVDGNPSVGAFVLTGRIQDFDGNPLPGALVRLVTGKTPLDQSAQSDANGQYRFENVVGRVTVSVSKNDYGDASSFLWVTGDVTFNVTLQRLLQLVPGTMLQGTVHAPPCDPVGWDGQALCQTIYFTSPTTDLYELVLTWDGPNELDMLIDGGQYFTAARGGTEIRALVPGPAGVRREIRIHSYYAPQAFTLIAIPQPRP